MGKENLQLYSFPLYDSLAEQLKLYLPLDKNTFLIERFPNKELHISLFSPPSKKTCYILGTLAPPESHLFVFQLLCHTLKKEGAEKVVGIIPYLSYSRHDKPKPLKSQATALLGKLLAASGLDELITLDIHNPKANHLFPFPICSISPAQLFAEEIKRLSLGDCCVVSPDEGATQRCKDVANQLGMPNRLILMQKTRGETEIIHHELAANVQRKAVIIDDILDTGKTLISCCASLLKHGAEEIIIMVTHGLFTGEKWQKLFDMGVKKIYYTDSFPIQKNILENTKISILPIASLLANEIKVEKVRPS